MGIGLIFFLFLHENICCGYSLEAPRRGASNEYHNIGFHGEIRKMSLLLDCLFVCVEVLRPRQPNGVISSAVSLPNHMFTGQA